MRSTQFHLRTTAVIAVASALLAYLPTLRAVTPAPDGGYAGQNTAEGTNALFSLTTGFADTAIGFQALFHDTSGSYNTAEGSRAAFNTTTGNFNIAIGWQALNNNATGSSNIAIGASAGSNIFLGNNIDIGNAGVSDDFSTIRIGTEGTHLAAFIAGVNDVTVAGAVVCVSSSGQLGECDVAASPTSMNDKKLDEQTARIAEQEKMIRALAATIKEQAAQIQKVSAELTVMKAKPQLVANQK